MSTAALKEVTTGKVEKPKDFPSMLQVWLPEIKRALPKHLNADRMSRIALTAFRRTPKLGDCDPRSVFAAVIQASQLGLEPDTLGRSYLIPYANRKKVNGQWTSTMECQFVPGWKGLMDLMNRSGQGSAWTGAVYSGDFFEYELGDTPRCKHVPAGEDNSPDKLTHVYAIGRAKGSDWPVIEVWPVAKVRKHRDRYNKVGDRHYSFENWEMYARKVVLLQVLKYLPCTPELVAAMALNDAAEIGAQKIDLKDAIEGQWENAVDVGTGEVLDQAQQRTEEGAPAVSYEALKKQITDATDVDVLDVAADTIGALDDVKQQDELREIAKKRRAELQK